MSAQSNPPQLQLSLGHQTFKRSFHQFGLDVDDDDSEGGAASSSSSGSRSVSTSGSAHGSTGARSVSSGSSYSSQGGDVYGYNGTERNERNKRARSEGPDGASIDTSSTSSTAESMDEASVLSFPSSNDTGNTPEGTQGTLDRQALPGTTSSDTFQQHLSSHNEAPGFTLPTLDFGPSTPSVAEFVALRTSSSSNRTMDNPPGFADMLSPRSSSPVPPPAQEVDVAMRDDVDDDLFSSFDSHQGRQNSTSNAFLNSDRSDTLLNSATERLREAMERARTFDRMLAPLRSDAADGAALPSLNVSRPRLPPFDFEAHRRNLSSPRHGGVNGNSNAAPVRTPFNQRPQQSNTTNSPTSGYSARQGATFPETRARTTSLNRRHLLDSIDDLLLRAETGEDANSEELDDILVDRELSLDSSENTRTRPPTGESPARSRVLLSRRYPPLEIHENTADTMENSVRSTNILTNRTIDDLTSFISTSESEDDARLSSLAFSGLERLHSSFSETNVSSASGSTGRSDLSSPVPRPSQEALSRDSLSLSSSFYGLGSPDLPDPNPSLSPSQVANRARNERDQSRLVQDRIPPRWPWSDSQNASVQNPYMPELASRSNSYSGSPASTRPQSQLHSTSFHPTFTPNSVPDGPTPDTESDIRRMVQLDMDTSWSRRSVRNNFRPAHQEAGEPARSRSFTSRRPSSLVLPPPRPNLPTLRSAILGELGNESSLNGLLAEDQLDESTAYATGSQVAPSTTNSLLRARALHGEHAAIHAFRDGLENLPQERTSPGRRGMPVHFHERQHQAQRVPPMSEDFPSFFPDGNHTTWSRAARTNERPWEEGRPGRSGMSSGQGSNASERLRDLADNRREMRMFENWLRQSVLRGEERTRLREMRERHRLSIHPQIPSQDRAERPISSASIRHEPQRWSSVENAMRTSGFSAEGETRRFDTHQTRTEPDGSDSASIGLSSSTEAAAFFASGHSYGSSREVAGRLSPGVLRQRRLRLLPELNNGERELWDDFDMNIDPMDTYGFGSGSDLRSSPSPIAQPENPTSNASSSASNELLQLLNTSRGVRDANLARGANPNSSVIPQEHRMDDFSDLPPLQESRVRMRNFEHPAQNSQNANASPSGRWRSLSLRSSSRPPSLPPLRFQHLSTLDGDARGEGFGAEDYTTDFAPWRRTPFAEQSDSSTSTYSSRNAALQRNSDLALHHAMMLRSVQARQGAARQFDQEHQRTTAGPTAPTHTAGRAQGFEHAMNVLGVDGLSPSRRQQFSSAFERERDRTRPPRIDTHVRWGEIAEDGSEARPSAHSPRSWAETFRSRRRSVSALFAPPPDNADTTPPNRARGTGTAAADPSAQAQASSASHDWFSMISSSRARARHRARLGRTDEESGPRSFFRFGRNRSALRNIGDFVRDEDFDTSYEGLLALAATLGDVKPRATPAHVLNALPNGLYKDWQCPGCDTRCPICLDDYKDADVLLKAEPCAHWCHKECLEQWLHTAQTCPVCRTKIKSSQQPPTPPPVAGPSRINRMEAAEGSEDSEDELSFLSNSSMRGYRNINLFEVLGNVPRSPPP